MTKITTGASVSLDGYISGPAESGFEHLFAWYETGDVNIPTTGPDVPINVTEASAAHLREMIEATGCFVVGRHLFDMTNGWGGKHTLGIPYVVLTHSVPDGWERSTEWYEFCTGTLEDAIEAAERRAGGKNVGLNAGTIATQALAAGLLDEVDIDLVPVVLGGGTPYFGSLPEGPYVLEGPIKTVQGERVTHLRYRVTKSA
jgi:dihydrofolate reductase